MNKRLYRSRVDSKIAGVCGGLGDYFDIDPTIIRIIAIVSTFIHGIGLIAYIVAWIAMPEIPFGQEVPIADKPRKKSSWNSSMTGLVLVGIGIIFLADDFFRWYHFHDYFWAMVLILVGGALIFKGVNRDDDSGSFEENTSDNSQEINNV